eukprot:15344516-Ditylum_brightwellii.AAC.1
MIFAAMAIALNMLSMFLQKSVTWNVACSESYIKKHHDVDPSFEKLCYQHIDGHEKCFCEFRCCIDMCQHPWFKCVCGEVVHASWFYFEDLDNLDTPDPICVSCYKESQKQ